MRQIVDPDKPAQQDPPPRDLWPYGAGRAAIRSFLLGVPRGEGAEWSVTASRDTVELNWPARATMVTAPRRGKIGPVVANGRVTGPYSRNMVNEITRQLGTPERKLVFETRNELSTDGKFKRIGKLWFFDGAPYFPPNPLEIASELTLLAWRAAQTRD